MFGLAAVSLFAMIMVCVLVATFIIGWHINRNAYGSLEMTGVVFAVLLAVGVILMVIRSRVLYEYGRHKQFEDPLVVRNDTQDALLAKVRAETMWISRTFEVTLLPGDVAYFSSTAGYYRLLNTRKLDDGNAVRRYDRLSKD